MARSHVDCNEFIVTAKTRDLAGTTTPQYSVVEACFEIRV